MKPKPKRVEAVKAWGCVHDGKLFPSASQDFECWRGTVRVRIIREADYQRLLKAAKGAKLTK